MPIQAPQWTDYLNCPVCCREFGASPRSPVSLGCGHTICRHCLKHFHRKHCPFDQTSIQVEPEELVVNTALLQLAGYTPPAQPHHPPSIKALVENDKLAYNCIVKCMEELAAYLKNCNVNNGVAGNRLSRPMQRKLVMLLQSAITDEEGRGRAARAARSLGERTVTELILQHQNSQQLSANLWAAVRARGCQFLGPAMQDEVLKLVLLALEDGSALSRKVLVMFVVQRLEPHFAQASKTSIGHVVQLLYRASCFKVSKRECDSSLMQLKDEFRTYETLRREHDAQIVQIATEAGLRIAPDQWSCLLYGDTGHKSHMQSIIDKLQTPQSFAQSVQELFIALQRTGDPAQLTVMSIHLDKLASIDSSPDAESPSWQQLAEIMTSLREAVAGLIHYLQQQALGRDSNHNQKHNSTDRCMDTNNSPGSPQTAASTPTHTKYKVSMCRDATTKSFCPRGNACTFAHSEQELEKFRINMNGNNQHFNAYPAPFNYHPDIINIGLPRGHSSLPLPLRVEVGEPPHVLNGPASFHPVDRNHNMVPHYPPHFHMPPEAYNVAPMPTHANLLIEVGEVPHVSNGHVSNGQGLGFGPVMPPRRPLYNLVNREPPNGEHYHQEFNAHVPDEFGPAPYRADLIHPPRFVPAVLQNNVHVPGIRDNAFAPQMPQYRFPQMYHNAPVDPHSDAVWAPNAGEVFQFGEMMSELPVFPKLRQRGAANAADRAAPAAERRVRNEATVDTAQQPAEPSPARAPIGPAAQSPPVVSVAEPTVSATASLPIPTMENDSELPILATTGLRPLLPGEPGPSRSYHNAFRENIDNIEDDDDDDQELEAGLQEIKRRIDSEFEDAE